ncbi:type II toxin-antitoxin system RelE/ParE family toxin [Escherichia coli]|nr:type II toxin-antitoxin system RelE/ParE family toxin [Escherichia coli]
MRLEWKPMSLSDREQIMEYISKDNPLAAIALDNQFEAIAEQACERPEMYRAGRVAGTHEAVVRPHYVLIYQSGGRYALGTACFTYRPAMATSAISLRALSFTTQ